MSAAGYGALGAVVLVASIAVAGTVDRSVYTAAEATVFRIDRTCSFTRVTDGGPGNQVAEGIEQDCSATDEFKAIASAPKSSMDVAGEAVVKVSYTAPQDRSSQVGQLEFDGHDDQFYALKAGDKVRILVAKRI